MALSQTKKVLYSSNQRLDLNDKLAEADLMDSTLANLSLATLTNPLDGRVFSGWRTTTVNGANSGFTIAAEPAAAVDRSGNLLVLDGSVALTVSLQQNAVNYVSAYYSPTPSDPGSRRFFQSGVEVSNTTNTRTTRAPNLYRSNTALGSPAWAGFAATTVISGATVQLLPLYAITVDNTNTITSVTDYRPMFAPSIGSAGSNQYETASTNADLPFNFSPGTNAATLGITSVRHAILGIVDRIKNIKGTTNWYDSAQNQFAYTSANGGLLSSSWNAMQLGAPNLKWGYASAYAPDGILSTTGSYVQTITNDGLHFFIGPTSAHSGGSAYTASLNPSGFSFHSSTSPGAALITAPSAPLHIIGSSANVLVMPGGVASDAGVACFEQTQSTRGPGGATGTNRDIAARMSLGPYNSSPGSALATSSFKIVEYALFDWKDDYVSAGAGSCGGIGAFQGWLTGSAGSHTSVLRIWDYSLQQSVWLYQNSSGHTFSGANVQVPELSMNSAKTVGVDHTRFFVISGSPAVDTSNGNALTIPTGASVVVPIHLPGSISAITSIKTAGLSNGGIYQTVLYKVNGTTGVSTSLAFSTGSTHTQSLVYGSFTDTLSGTFPIVSPDESLYLQINASGGVSTAIKYIVANVASLTGMGSPRL